TVTVDGRPLFRVRGTSSITAEDRARQIAGLISDAAADPTLSPDSLFISETPIGTQILAGDTPLVMVSDADAHLERVTRSQVAVRILARIRVAIANYRTERSANNLLFSGLIALAATAGLAVALAILAWLRRRVESLMRRRLQKRMSHLKP